MLLLFFVRIIIIIDYYFYEVWNVGIDLVRNMKSYTLYRFHEQIG